MSAKTSIEWCHHTFSPWWGCARVSPGCEHCYAEKFAKRVGQKVWGVHAERRFFGDAHWAEPLRWNRAAEKAGERHRVFCASMADVFEDRDDLRAPRARLYRLVSETPHLDWLLLTKRPEHADYLWAKARYDAWQADRAAPVNLSVWRSNVWLGTTVEDQQRADERIPQLLRVPAAVRFLSCEPLLEAVRVDDIGDGSGGVLKPLVGLHWVPTGKGMKLDGGKGPQIGWVIAGAESGHSARPMDEDWIRSLRDQCAAAGVAFFYKQRLDERGRKVGLPTIDGRQWAEFPR